MVARAWDKATHIQGSGGISKYMYTYYNQYMGIGTTTSKCSFPWLNEIDFILISQFQKSNTNFFHLVTQRAAIGVVRVVLQSLILLGTIVAISTPSERNRLLR